MLWKYTVDTQHAIDETEGLVPPDNIMDITKKNSDSGLFYFPSTKASTSSLIISKHGYNVANFW